MIGSHAISDPLCFHDGVAPGGPATVNSVRFNPLSRDELADQVAAFIDCGRSHIVHFFAAHPTVLARRNAAYRDLVNRGDLNVPDGMAVVWALRLLGVSAQQLTGTEGMWHLCDWGRARGLRHYLLGGSPAALERLRHALQAELPAIRITGALAPPFRPLSDAELIEIGEGIRRSRAHVVWIGLGVPKQDLVAERLRELGVAPVLICVGAAFDFLSGMRSRAPRWMRSAGLEWLHRLCNDPARLWRRYLLGNPQFIAGVLSDYIRMHTGGSERHRIGTVSVKRTSLRRIAAQLYPICLDVEERIAEQPFSDAALWAKADSVRHAHTVQAIVKANDPPSHSPLRILNASGLYHGHQDFSIAAYFKQRGIPYRWVVSESPESAYLSNAVSREYRQKLEIEIRPTDYRDGADLGKSEWDVALFTEIAEHLDHSALLSVLKAIHRALVERGIIIITTPNAVSVPNRVRALLGHGDQPYFGDGIANLEAGLYGHIASFDIDRLQRLLGDAGFEIEQAYTFDWGRAWKGARAARLVITTLDLVSRIVPNGEQGIFISARKSESRRPIPCAT